MNRLAMTLELRRTSNLRRGFDWIAQYWIASWKIMLQKLFKANGTGEIFYLTLTNLQPWKIEKKQDYLVWLE